MRNLPRFRPKLQTGSRRRKRPRNRQCLGEMRVFLINRPKDQRINNCMETATLMDSAVPSRWREKGGESKRRDESGHQGTRRDENGTKGTKPGTKRDRKGTAWDSRTVQQKGPASSSAARSTDKRVLLVILLLSGRDDSLVKVAPWLAMVHD